MYRSLAEKDERAAELYEAAICGLTVSRTSTRFCSAAHLIRLMMAEVPKFFDLPALTSLPLLTNQVNKLGDAWTAAADSGCRTPDGWSGNIDAALRGFLAESDALFLWRREQRSKEEITGEALRRSDPAPVGVPENLIERRAKRWIKLFQYFNAVAHGSSSDLDRFDQHLEEVEDVILSLLSRTPSEGFAAIDVILTEEDRGLKPETTDRAIHIIERGGAEYVYFFEHATSTAWIEPLFRRGFFQRPPEPEDRGQYISFPMWPE